MKTNFKPLQTFLTIIFLFLFSFAFGQIWETELTFNYKSEGRKIIPTSDGNFLGLVNEQIDIDSTFIHLFKFNTEGDILWTKNLGFGFGLEIITDSNNEIIIGGGRSNNSFFSKVLFIKLNENGEFIGEVEYEDGYISSILENPTGGYFIGGNLESSGSLSQSFLKSISAFGFENWSTSYPVSSNSVIQKMFWNANNNQILALGGTEVVGVGLDGFFLKEISPIDGSETWTVIRDVGYYNEILTYTYNDFQSMGALEDADGNIVITYAGSPAYGDGSSIYKYNKQGELLHSISLTYFGVTEHPLDIGLDNEGNYIVVGGYEVGNFQKKFIKKISPIGQILWSQKLDDFGRFLSMTISPDQFINLIGVNTYPDPDIFYNSFYQPVITRIDSTGNIFPYSISGKVVLDENANCTLDAGEAPLKNWKLVLNSNQDILTDDEGNFNIGVDSGTYHLEIISNSNLWENCQDEFNISLDESNPMEEIIFLVQKGNTDCPFLEVGITQPDLIPCEESTFIISWSNRGNADANDVEIFVTLDESLSIVDATLPFTQNGDQLIFDLGNVAFSSKGFLELTTELSCDVSYYKLHCVEAVISPKSNCWSDTNSDLINHEIEGICENGNVTFTVFNNSSIPILTPVDYRLFANGALIENSSFVFSNSNSVEIEAIADGKTITLEVDQNPFFPVESNPVYSIEGCGEGTNGTFGTGYANMYFRNDTEPWISKACIENTHFTTGNRIFEIPKGWGTYHLMENEDRTFEFSLKVLNPENTITESVTIQLIPTEGFDLSSFEPISANGDYNWNLKTDGIIEMTMNNLNLPSGEELYLRFKLKYFQQSEDFISINALVFFNQNSAAEPYSAFYNILDEDFIPEVVSPDPNIDNVSVFGKGNSFDFINDFTQTPDGNIYLNGSYSTFGEGSGMELIKTDSLGQYIWTKSYKILDSNPFRSQIVALPNNDIIIVGNVDDPAVLGTTTQGILAFAIRINHEGDILWENIWKYNDAYSTRITSGILMNESILLYGRTYSEDLNFLTRIDLDGNIISEQEIQIGNNVHTGGIFKMMSDSTLVFAVKPASDDLLLSKFDLSGNLLLSQIYNFSDYPSFYDLIETSDGKMLLAGNGIKEINPGEYVGTPYLVKTNNEFQQEWIQKPQISFYFNINNVIEADSSFYFSGTILSDTIPGSNVSAAMLKMDFEGEYLWHEEYDTKAREYGEKILLGQHNRIWMTAQTQTTDNLYDLQMLLISKLDGDLVSNSTENLSKVLSVISLFPNPSSDLINIKLPPNIILDSPHFELFDFMGKKLRGGTLSNEKNINISGLTSGEYFIKIYSYNKMYIGKFIKI